MRALRLRKRIHKPRRSARFLVASTAAYLSIYPMDGALAQTIRNDTKDPASVDQIIAPARNSETHTAMPASAGSQDTANQITPKDALGERPKDIRDETATSNVATDLPRERVAPECPNVPGVASTNPSACDAPNALLSNNQTDRDNNGIVTRKDGVYLQVSPSHSD